MMTVAQRSIMPKSGIAADRRLSHGGWPYAERITRHIGHQSSKMMVGGNGFEPLTLSV